AQEEPRNQGAWHYLAADRLLAGTLPRGLPLHYAGRPAAAAPAGGNLHVHLEEQQRLLTEALGLESEPIAARRADRQSAT
ncbi:MAG: hypothetical protein ACFCVA_08785, partial [Gammaproteobacteria bacterium]